MKEARPIYTAFDASAHDLYVPGLRQHIRNALALGATTDEVMEVFEIASVIGIHTCTMGVPILIEESPAAPCRPCECRRLRKRNSDGARRARRQGRCLVTGGAERIGAATAHRLAREEAHVVVVDASREQRRSPRRSRRGACGRGRRRARRTSTGT